jgi:diaminohydroxyphosphoribosylaminopyrimidine deaminase/5-amino-6-(5-phosphoribosylamino)uracil reductase
MSVTDEVYMRRALELAEKGRGRTSPNPMVGAVVVKSGRILAEGYHRRAGAPHAEAVALKKAGSRAEGSTLYLNLEPCSHLDKRTPPCAPLIIERRIRRLVIAVRDPNPKVNGKGIALLRRAGIEVAEGILKREALRLNEVYIKYVTTGRPFVISKAAMSLDGKIATAKGSTTGITGEMARLAAHRLRDRSDAILVGIQTVLTDNPRLTTRIPGITGRDAHRVIVDSTLKISPTARLLTQKSIANTIIATTRRAHPNRIRALEQAGAMVWVIKDQDGRVSLPELMSRLGDMGVTSVLIEGGGELNASAFSSGIVDKLVWFISPKIIGRQDAVAVIEGPVNHDPEEAIPIRDLSITRVGEDLMLEGYL